MKEPALLIKLRYLPGTVGAGNICFDYQSISDHKQHMYLTCPVDLLTAPGTQARHLNVTETKESKFIYDGGFPFKDILHRNNCTRYCEGNSEIQIKESVDDCGSFHLNDGTSTEQVEYNPTKQPDVFLECSRVVCDPCRDPLYEDAKLQSFSKISTCSNLDNKDAHNENRTVNSLKCHVNNICKTKHDLPQIILEDKCYQKQKTQIGYESSHEVNCINYRKLPSISCEIDKKILNSINKDSVNENMDDGAMCEIQKLCTCYETPHKNSFPGLAGHVHLKNNQLDKRNGLCIEHYSLATEENPHRDKTNLQNQEENKGIISKNKESSIQQSFLNKYLSCRWKLAYLCFMARFIQTALRQCMGIAIIGMTMKSSTGDAANVTNATCNSSQSEPLQTIQEFQWSSVFEGFILASFNVGSIVTPIIVGYITTRHGGRKLMSACLLFGGTFTVLLPLAAKADPAFIIVFRILTGMALSGTDSLIQGMWSQWAPLYEKASLSACAYSGLSVAGILTFLVCGYIVSIGGEGHGWPYIFYIFVYDNARIISILFSGSMSFLLAPLWYITVYDRPEDHPQITKQELAIITFSKRPEHFHHYKKELNTPWRQIFLSSAVWVIVMGHVTHKWVLTFMLSYLPRYFSDLFDFGIRMNGFFSSLPFVGRVISGVIAGHVSDWMLKRGVSTVRTRKSFQAVGCWSCAVCSLIIAFVPNLSTVWSVLLLVLALSCQDLTSVAFRINLLDIAPRYAGIINGVASTIATVTSLPAPVLTSLLISGGSKQGWQMLFCVVAVLNTIGGTLFVIFAKGEIQDWAQSEHHSDNTHNANELMVFTLEGSSDIKSTELNDKKTTSLSANLHQPCNQEPASVVQRVTLDFGSMVKTVQNHSFSNLALADL